MIDEIFTRESYVPLNEKGEEMTFEELDAYVKSFPTLESPQKLEDISTLIDEPVDEWVKNNGLISIREFALKRGVNIDEI